MVYTSVKSTVHSISLWLNLVFTTKAVAAEFLSSYVGFSYIFCHEVCYIYTHLNTPAYFCEQFNYARL